MSNEKQTPESELETGQDTVMPTEVNAAEATNVDLEPTNTVSNEAMAEIVLEGGTDNEGAGIAEQIVPTEELLEQTGEQSLDEALGAKEVLQTPEVNDIEVVPVTEIPDSVKESATYNELVAGGFKVRLVTEQKELADKVSKLESFTSTITFRALTRPEKDDLKTQLKYMKKYLAVVNRRVARL